MALPLNLQTHLSRSGPAFKCLRFPLISCFFFFPLRARIPSPGSSNQPRLFGRTVRLGETQTCKHRASALQQQGGENTHLFTSHRSSTSAQTTSVYHGLTGPAPNYIRVLRSQTHLPSNPSKSRFPWNVFVKFHASVLVAFGANSGDCDISTRMFN